VLKKGGFSDMKKKQALALLLAAAMVSATSMTAWAELQEDPVRDWNMAETISSVDGHAHPDVHGSEDGAVVGEHNDTVEQDIDVDIIDSDINNDQQGNTQFYINIDKDVTSDTGITIPDYTDITGKENICHYDIEWETTRKAHLSVTVPLYVCMFGYGGDGKVVAPSGDEYQLTNNSTYQDYQTLKAIYPCYTVYNLKDDYRKIVNTLIVENADSDHFSSQEKYDAYAADTESIYRKYLTDIGVNLQDYVDTGLVAENTDDEGTTTYSLTPTALSGEYGCYVKADKEAYIVAMSDCDTHTDDSACENHDKVDYFFRDKPETPVTEVTIAGEDYIVDTTKRYATAEGKQATDAVIALTVNVPTIKAEVSTWAIRKTSDVGNLKAGEITMLVNGLDLFEVEQSADNSMDIKDLGWVIPAPTKEENKEELTPGTLGLPVEAAIAGGNVNNEGCVPVVRVTYTVSPVMESIANTTYVKIASAN
jgi:hypothetical protein